MLLSPNTYAHLKELLLEAEMVSGAQHLPDLLHESTEEGDEGVPASSARQSTLQELSLCDGSSAREVEWDGSDLKLEFQGPRLAIANLEAGCPEVGVYPAPSRSTSDVK
jgi:hypothetical protein